MWSCMCFRVFEKIFKIVNNAFPMLRNSGNVVSDTILPFIILPVCLLIGTISLTVTAVLILILTAGSMYITSRPKTRSPFFYSWTLSTILTMYLEFQLFVMRSMGISFLEVTITLVLVLFTCYHFYKMKKIANELMSKRVDCNAVHVFASETRYCRICRIIVKEKLFHSIWWDCCVSKPNYLYFLTGQMFALVTLVYGTNLSLTTLCENTQFINNLLLPIRCTYVYDNSIRYTLPFVTAMYGIGYSLIVMMVLLRQITIYIPKYADMQLRKNVQVTDV